MLFRSINTISPANTLTVQGTLNVTSQPTRSGDLFVASNGNVGIGTTTPGAKLQIIGNVSILDVNGQGLIIRETDDGNNAVKINSDSQQGAIHLYDQGTEEIGLYTQSNSYVNTGFNFGIGTTSPQETLSVVGNISTTQTNATLGNFTIVQFNSTCSGFRFGTNGGMILSCAP